MSVPEQIPTVSYTANGTTTNFPITFELSDERYLVVTKNMEIPPVGAYTVSNGEVVFGVAPNEGDIITLMRDTVLDRETNYQNYDNSFRPEAVNYDLDKIWHVLQEQNLIDAKLLARLKEEIEWRRTHDANFDELALMRDSQVFSGLKQYVDTYIAATNPNIFGGITAGIVFALDQKSVQTHLDILYQELVYARQLVEDEELRAISAETLLQNQINVLGTGNKAYLTYAAMDADIANIPANSKVTVTNDPTSSNNGDWQWDGTNFSKSIYDPLTQAKTYTDTKMNAVIEETDSSVPPVSFVDEDGWFYGGFYEDGSMETPLFKINNYYNNGFIVIDEDGWILLEQSTTSNVSKDWSQKNILLFGDSITETSNVEAGIYDSLAYRQNWLLYAFAMLEIQSFRNFARSGASYREYSGQLDWQKISHQVDVAISTGFTPDIVVIACGTNDGISNLGDYDTAMSKNIVDLDMSLTAEALRKNLYNISQAYPNAKLFSCLPLQRADVETSTRQPLLDLIRKMSGRYGFTVIDCHNETGIVKDFEVWGSSGRDLYDGLHPKTSGQIKQAKLISAKIKSNYQLQV